MVTLLEAVISALVMALVLGSAVGLSMQLQRVYSTQFDEAVAEEEARYALDWIARDLRSAASDPYNVIPFGQSIWIDPNGGDDPDDSLRVQADVNPSDGDIADAGENVIIALDIAEGVITRQDTNGADPSALAMTDAVITDLHFTCLDAERKVTASPELISFIRIEVTAESRRSTRYATTLTTEVRVRTR